MSRRKQNNPRFIKDGEELPVESCPVADIPSFLSDEEDDEDSLVSTENLINDFENNSITHQQVKEEQSNLKDSNDPSESTTEDEDDDQEIEEPFSDDSTDIYSSPPSSNYSTSLSDGVVTPISSINDSIKSEDPTLRLNEERKLKYLKTLPSTDGTYSCQFCSKTFPRLGYLKKHEQSHAEHMPFRCDYCARLFKHKRSRDRHTKLHTGDRRYKCPHCEAAFSRSDHLKIHMKTHDNRKPFQCTVCNRGYNTAAALTSHMQNHKKQQQQQQQAGNSLHQPGHLMGATNRTPNYSPRSNCSTPKSGKRKYSSAFMQTKDAVVGGGGGGTSALTNGHLDMRNRMALDGLNTPSPNSLLNLSNRVCVYCTKSDFQSTEQLFNHIQTKHYGLLFPTYNPMPFGDYRQLKYNLEAPGASLAEKTFDCHICPEAKYPSVQLLYQHLRTFHIDQAAMSRDTASLGSPSKEDVRRRHDDDSREEDEKDMNNNNNDEIKENIKSEASYEEEEDQHSPTDLSKPKKMRHNEQDSPARANEEPKNFLCNQCNAGFGDFESFRKHLKSHIAPPVEVDHYSCKQCSMDFSSKQRLEEHNISHYLVEDVEYNCVVPNCSKSAKIDEIRKHYLEQHMQVVFKCTICAEGFESKVALELHFTVAHRFQEAKVFRCSTCVEVFHNIKDFRHHVTTRHMGRMGIQCIFCPVTCDSDLEMHFHLSTHSKQFQCPICPESFHVEFLLDRHMQSHQIGKADPRPDLTQQQYLFEKQSLMQKRPMLIPPGSPIMASQFHMKQPPYPPHLLNQLYLSNAMARDHPLFWARNDLRQRMAMSSPRMDYYHHQEPHLNNNHHSKENGKEPHPANNNNNNEGSFGAGGGDAQDNASDSEASNQRKIGHSIKTGVSLRCAYCNGDFRSRTELENHMKSSHNTSGKHKCLICDDISPSATLLAEHKLTHCKIGLSSECCYCQESLTDSMAFKNHLRQHNATEFPIQCICCRQTLNSEFEIGLHAKFHTKEPESTKRTCALCLGDLPEDSPNPKICAQCSERHNIRQGLSKLMGRSDDQKNDMNECSQCDDTFDTPGQLQDHVRAEHPTTASPSKDDVFMGHVEEAQLHDCRSCSQRFHFKEDLEEHVAQQHLTKEVIKREREDSDDDDDDDVTDNGREESSSAAEMIDTEARMAERDAAAGAEEGDEEQGGNGSAVETAGDSERDPIVNVESEIKIDNDSYATVFYCRR